MDTLEWLKVVSAVLAGNALTAWCIWSVWTITKIEKAGGKPSDAPWGAIFGGIIPPLIVAAGGYLLKVSG